MIHPTAIVHAEAEIGAGCEIGPYCVIGKGVVLGENCWLHSHVVLEGPSRSEKLIASIPSAPSARERRT
jgi:UDP-N-acetylglucosamine acyltransferase